MRVYKAIIIVPLIGRVIINVSADAKSIERLSLYPMVNSSLNDGSTRSNVVITIVIEIIHGCVRVGEKVIPEIFVIGLLVSVYAMVRVMVIKIV